MDDLVVRAGDGTRLAVQRTGSGPAVVLVHGSGGGLRSWAGVAALLARDHEVWTYARRGYGPSDVPPGPGRFADDAADLLSVVEATGRPAHVAGGSFGALVALEAARSAPSDVRSLALYEPPLFAVGPHAVADADALRAAVADDDMAAASAVLDRVTRVPDEVLAQFASVPPADPAEDRRQAAGWLRDLEAMSAADPDPGAWAGVEVPVLLAQGSESWDPLPVSVDAVAAVLPGARRVVWLGQSHFATAAAPQLVADTLRDWFVEG